MKSIKFKNFAEFVDYVGKRTTDAQARELAAFPEGSKYRRVYELISRSLSRGHTSMDYQQNMRTMAGLLIPVAFQSDPDKEAVKQLKETIGSRKATLRTLVKIPSSSGTRIAYIASDESAFIMDKNEPIAVPPGWNYVSIADLPAALDQFRKIASQLKGKIMALEGWEG